MNKSNESKSYLLKLIKVFWVIVIILTFFSKTISRHSLTTVRAEYPQIKKLTKEVVAEGNIGFKSEYTLYAPFESKILEVYVEEGEKVEKGQKLCKLDTSLREYQEKVYSLKLEENQIQLEFNKEKIKQLEARIEEKQLEVNECKAEKYEITVADEMEIQKLTKQVEVNEALYKEGGCALKEVEEAKLALEQKQSEIKEVQAEKIDTQRQEEKNLLNEITEMKEQVKTLEEENKKLMLNSKGVQLEADKDFQEQLTNDVLYAQESGVVQKIKIQKGQSIGKGEEVIQLGDCSEGYVVPLQVDSKIDFVAVGDEVEVMIPSLQKRDIIGEIKKITLKENQKEISVRFNEEGLQGNENVKVKFAKTSEEAYPIVSYNALQKDNAGYFVYILRKIKSPLGEDYIVTRKDVKLIDFTESYAAVNEQLQDNEMILTTSEKPIQQGERVKVENETELLGAYENE